MGNIRTIELRDQEAFERFQDSLLSERESGNPFSRTEKVYDFRAFVEKAKRCETKTDHPDWSTYTTYYYFKDGEIAAKLSCRWQLEKGELARVGGHIGYATSPIFRRQGIMQELLTFAFERFREKGIQSVLITALADNHASRKLIEKVGGRLENIISIEEDCDQLKIEKELARYWVQI